MGCTAKPWDYAVNGKIVSIDEAELKRIREDFWKNHAQGDAEVWSSLQTCCTDFLDGKIDDANAILQRNGITVVSGDLSLVRDRNGNVYKIEKYCYSTPQNVEQATGEGNGANSSESENNKFRFRVGASFLDEEREVIYIFDKGDEETDADVVPKEHSPENHLFFHTYHFKDDLSTVTERQIHDKMLGTIENFPEVKGKIAISGIRLFYMGRELNRNTPFISNHIPFDSVIVVLVQCACCVCDKQSTHHALRHGDPGTPSPSFRSVATASACTRTPARRWPPAAPAASGRSPSTPHARHATPRSPSPSGSPSPGRTRGRRGAPRPSPP